MFTKLNKLFVMTMILALVLSACAQQPAAQTPAAQQPAAQQPATQQPAAPDKKQLNIAVVVKAVTSDYWKLVGAGVEDAMKADPTIKATFLGPNEETDIEGQIRIIEAQISAKVDALAVAPSQADQLQPTLQKAVDAGIPVVLIDTNISTFDKKAAFVGTDNKLGGQLAGEFIAKALKSGDEVAIIRGAAGDPVHNLREEGAKEAFDKAGLKVAAVQPADSDRAKGQTVAENLLTANPNLKAIYATNDEMALGALNAAKAAGKTLVIVGFDASPDALKSIAAGELSGSVAQFPGKIGELGTLTAAKVARGEKVDAFVNTGVDVVSTDNLSKFYSGAAAGDEKKELNVAVVVKAVTSDYWKLVGAGVADAMKTDPTIKATFLGPNEETDIEGQIRIIEAQISAKVDALAVAPSQADQLQPTLQKAVDAGIPVVLIDTNIATFDKKSAFVGTDNKLGGQLAGEFIAKSLKSGDEVAIIRGAAGDPVHNLREEGAKAALEAAGIKVVAVQPADSDRAKGQTVAENLLTANPNLKAIYATNDEMALGALNAAKAAGKTLITVGFDASPDALKSIDAGELSGSIAQFPGKIGELGTLTAAAVARGEKVEAFVNTGVDVVSKANIGDFLAGATSSGGEKQAVNIAVVVKAVTSDYWKLVGAGVEAAMKTDPSVTATFLGPNEETDIEGQIRIIEAQISAKVDALAVAPSQADQLQPTLQKAVDAGIPVVLIDTNISTFDAKSAFVGTDNKLGGQLAGEFIAKALKAGDEVAIIRGAAGDPVHNLREEGAKAALEAAGLKVVAVQPADSDRAKGQTVAENLLTANPNLKAIYATNDEMALGAFNAAKAAGKTLVIVGFDASPDALKSIQAGELSGSIAQFASKIGELGTLTAAAVARGEKVEAFVNTGVAVVSKDNVGDFLK